MDQFENEILKDVEYKNLIGDFGTHSKSDFKKGTNILFNIVILHKF